jgi:hypothetical protein
MSAEIAFEREQGTVHNRTRSTNQPKIQEPPRVVHTWQLWEQPAYARFVRIPKSEKGFKVRAIEEYLRTDAGRNLSFKAQTLLRLLIDAAGADDRRYADGRLCCATWAGYKILAKRMGGVHTDTVKRGVAELVRAGLVLRTRVYRLNSVTVVEIPNVDAGTVAEIPGETNGAEMHQPPGQECTNRGGRNAPTHTHESHSPESEPNEVKTKPCGGKVGGVVATLANTDTDTGRLNACKHIANVLAQIGTPVATQLQIRRHCVDAESCMFAFAVATVVSILPEIAPNSKYAKQGPESPAVKLAYSILRKLWDASDEKHFLPSIRRACELYAGSDRNTKTKAAWVVNQCEENEDLECMLFGPPFDPDNPSQPGNRS